MMRNRIAAYLDHARPVSPELPAADRLRDDRSRWQAIRYALQGLHDAWQAQPNLRSHIYAGVSAVALGVWVDLSLIEWLWITFAIGLVIFAELLNTAIEHTVDLVMGRRYDPLARKAKDVAAGCVLAAAATALVIGILIFGPHLVIR